MSMIFPVAAVSVIGLASGLILSVASKVMEVKVDEKFIEVRGLLPGANCGACGYASCDSYAQALSGSPDTPTNLCIPGGNKVAADVSAALGRSGADVSASVAMVKCQGDCHNTTDKMIYEGPKTCADCKKAFGGKGVCSYSCMGFGDCVKACNYDAIYIQDGIAHIDDSKCVGCTLCVKACPSHIIEMTGSDNKVFVGCSSKDKGAVARKNCTVACIACKKCEKVCPTGAITVNDNLAHIDPALCTNCGLCVVECPTHAIVLKS